ncbi:MAG: alpha/beta hydrolase, partial [Acidimicrobiia bacterium]|nr:alpha/beta hydrolase [Acidimicrobiia bacterium]
ADPAGIGLAFSQVDVPGPLGNYPAWVVAADPADDTWAIVVHDKESAREQALAVLPALSEYAIAALVVTYRNDVGAPPSEGRHFTLGADEWEDLEAAVEFAIDAGARDVVLIGYGSGGGIALTFLRQSRLAPQVAGVILDSAYLDPGAMVDARIAANNVPGFLIGWGKAMATFRFGVEWALLDQVAAADDFSVPLLVFHGTADEQVPVRIAEAFAAALPGTVEYHPVAGADHLGPYAADPARYVSIVGHFLRRVAVGQSEAPQPEPDSGVE